MSDVSPTLLWIGAHPPRPAKTRPSIRLDCCLVQDQSGCPAKAKVCRFWGRVTQFPPSAVMAEMHRGSHKYHVGFSLFGCWSPIRGPGGALRLSRHRTSTPLFAANSWSLPLRQVLFCQPESRPAILSQGRQLSLASIQAASINHMAKNALHFCSRGLKGRYAAGPPT